MQTKMTNAFIFNRIPDSSLPWNDKTLWPAI